MYRRLFRLHMHACSFLADKSALIGWSCSACPLHIELLALLASKVALIQIWASMPKMDNDAIGGCKRPAICFWLMAMRFSVHASASGQKVSFYPGLILFVDIAARLPESAVALEA